MLKTLIAIVLVMGIGAAALPPAEDPDMLKMIAYISIVLLIIDYIRGRKFPVLSLAL